MDNTNDVAEYIKLHCFQMGINLLDSPKKEKLIDKNVRRQELSSPVNVLWPMINSFCLVTKRDLTCQSTSTR